MKFANDPWRVPWNPQAKEKAAAQRRERKQAAKARLASTNPDLFNFNKGRIPTTYMHTYEHTHTHNICIISIYISMLFMYYYLIYYIYIVYTHIIYSSKIGIHFWDDQDSPQKASFSWATFPHSFLTVRRRTILRTSMD